MRNIIYAEIEFRNGEIKSKEREIPGKYVLLHDINSIANNEELHNEILDFYCYLDDEYPMCAKFKEILFTFVHHDGTFICSVKYDKINRNKGSFRIGLLDWTGTGCKFASEDEEESEEEPEERK